MTISALKLSADNHDLVVKDGSIQLVTDSDVIARNLESRLQMFKGEWLLDNTYGYDFSAIFGKRIADLQQIETTLKSYILDTEGVTSISLFKLGYVPENTRLLTLTFNVITIYSKTVTIGGLTIG